MVLCDADNIAVDVALQLLVDHKAHWWFASCVFVHFLYALPLAYCNMFSLLAGCVGSRSTAPPIAFMSARWASMTCGQR